MDNQSWLFGERLRTILLMAQAFLVILWARDAFEFTWLMLIPGLLALGLMAYPIVRLLWYYTKQ